MNYLSEPVVKVNNYKQYYWNFTPCQACAKYLTNPMMRDDEACVLIRSLRLRGEVVCSRSPRKWIAIRIWTPLWITLKPMLLTLRLHLLMFWCVHCVSQSHRQNDGGHFLHDLPFYPPLLTSFLLPYSESILVVAREVPISVLYRWRIWSFEHPWLTGQNQVEKTGHTWLGHVCHMELWSVLGSVLDQDKRWGLIYPLSRAHKLIPDVLWVASEIPCLQNNLSNTGQ